MSFTDRDLATAMEDYLIDTGVVSIYEWQKLIESPTVINIASHLTPQQFGCFKAYWDALGGWMAKQGGNIAETTDQHVPGRVPTETPESASLCSLYKGAFVSVNTTTIGGDGFRPIDAVYRHFCFASALARPKFSTSESA